ncbi:NAD(+) synthase [Chloroflexota bacterium]
MAARELADKLVSWIRDSVTAAGCQGAMLGMSGGIDSSVLAVLCHRAFPSTTLGVLMPCYSAPEDAEHARLVADKFSIPTKTVVMDSAFDTLIKLIPADSADPAAERLAQANLKSRLRMLTLYYLGNRLKYMVVGSGNRSELAIGYYTKHGDSGVDILPLGNLVKREVRELATFLDIPRQIIDKPPSAGLWAGQTDESEMVMSYAELDHYLTTATADSALREKIETMIAANRHKRQPPPVPEF